MKNVSVTQSYAPDIGVGALEHRAKSGKFEQIPRANQANKQIGSSLIYNEYAAYKKPLNPGDSVNHFNLN